MIPSTNQDASLGLTMGQACIKCDWWRNTEADHSTGLCLRVNLHDIARYNGETPTGPAYESRAPHSCCPYYTRGC